MAPTSRTPRPVSSCLCAGPASRSYAASRREAVPSKAVASAAGWRRRPSSSRERRARSAEHRSNASFRGRAVGCASRTHEGLSARGRQLNARGQHDCEPPRILTRPPPARARRSSVARARPSVSVAGARPGPLHWLCVRSTQLRVWELRASFLWTEVVGATRSLPSEGVCVARALPPERVTLYLWGSGTSTIRIQRRQAQPHLAPPTSPTLTHGGFVPRLLQGAIIC